VVLEEDEEDVPMRSGNVRHIRTPIDNDLTALEAETFKYDVKRTLSVFQRTVEFIGMPEGGWLVDLDAQEKCQCLFWSKWGRCVHVIHFCLENRISIPGVERRTVRLVDRRLDRLATTGRNAQAHDQADAAAGRGGRGRGARGRGRGSARARGRGRGRGGAARGDARGARGRGGGRGRGGDGVDGGRPRGVGRALSLR
jgi:hypothetical protein